MIAIATLVRAKPAVVALLFVLVMTVSGCDDSGPIARLRAMPEAGLYAPGSKVVREFTTPRTYSPDGSSGASVGHNIVTTLDGSHVIAFYDQALRGDGWVPFDPTRGSNDAAIAGWTKDDLFFIVQVDEPDSLSPDAKAHGYITGYRAVVQQPYDAPTPTAAGGG